MTAKKDGRFEIVKNTERNEYAKGELLSLAETYGVKASYIQRKN